LAADDHLTGIINAMDLKYRLRDVETDCRKQFAWVAPPNRGSLNSAHIFGTHVPVEEPSTASIADLGGFLGDLSMGFTP
jgi:hypothetical protein